MTLEQEMKLWQTRSNDDFGKYLDKVDKMYREYIGEDESEYGFTTTPISHLKSIYALDGDAKSVYKKVQAIIEDYDLDEMTFEF